MADTAPSAADYAEQTLLSDVAVSPDGERVAVVATEFDRGDDERYSSVFVVPADGSGDPHRLTRASGASDPAWSPDGSTLGILAEREADLAVRGDSEKRGDDGGDGDADPSSQLWTFDLDRGGDARQVTAREHGVESFDWGPAGDRVVVAADDPTEAQAEYRASRAEGGPIVTRRLQHKYDGSGWLDDVATHLFVVDVGSREARRLDDAYGGGAAEPATGLAPAWSPDGDRIAFLSNRTDRPDDSGAMDLYTIRPDGTDLRAHTDTAVRASEPTWGPDGDRVAFFGRNPENMYDPTELYVADAAAEDYWSVSASLDRPAGRGGPAVWLDGETLLTAVGDEGLTRLVRFDAGSDDPERVFERQGRFRTVSTLHGAGGTLALALSEPGEGLDAFALDVADVDAGANDPDPLARLTRTNERLLDRYGTPQCRRVTFESEGVEVEAVVHFPEAFDPDDPDPAPLVASIHGGPVSYDAPEYDFPSLHWTERGYVVLRVNYRGSSSYGRSFSERISGEWGRREPIDVLNGVEEAVDRGWADPDRLFVTGFSYGGVTTAFVLTKSDRFRAAAAEHGIYDRYAYFGTGDSHNRMEADFGLPWEDEETYRSISSITDVGEIDTPLLVTAGGEDWRCPPTQAEQLYVSVRKQGVPGKLVVYPDENHGVTLPERAIHRLETIDDWFEEFDAGSGD